MFECRWFNARTGMCTNLTETPCDGVHKCKFYKTDEDFEREAMRSIELNRAKGNCTNCKYYSIRPSCIKKMLSAGTVNG